MNQKCKPRSALFIAALDCLSLGKRKGGSDLYQTLTDHAKHGLTINFTTENRFKSDNDNREHVWLIRFAVPRLKRLLQIKKVSFFEKILSWICFHSITFVKAQKLRSERKIDVTYLYKIYVVSVDKLLSSYFPYINEPMLHPLTQSHAGRVVYCNVEQRLYQVIHPKWGQRSAYGV